MHSFAINKVPQQKLLPVLQKIPFFKKLLDETPLQCRTLLEYSRLILTGAGEEVIKKGEFDSWFYFVLKGQLEVYPQQVSDKTKVIGYLGPGELFGALAMIGDVERNATVIVPQEEDKVLLLGVDFSPFDELENFSIIHLETKHAFYEMVVNITWQRLSNYREKLPEHSVSKKLAHFAPADFSPADNESCSLESLKKLSVKVLELSEMLAEWNISLESLNAFECEHVNVKCDLVDDLTNFLWGKR